MVDVDALWDFEDLAGSERRFAELQAEVLTQRARAAGLQGCFDEADRLLDEAEVLAEGARARTRVLLERGRVRRSSGDSAASKPLFLRAFELADDEALRIDAMHMLGIVDDPAWSERALELANASDDPRARRWRGALLNNIAWDKHGAGDYPAALELFLEGLAERRAHGTPRQVRMARSYVARCLRSLGRLEEALAEQEAVAAEDPEDAFVQAELAELRKARGRTP